MTDRFRLVPLDEARREVATLMLGDRDVTDRAVGEIDLWPHQRDAATRLRASIAEFGGALLADDVGTGKTFVALAVASRCVTPLVVAPAALRESWRIAGERAGRAPRFISFESLSRGRRPPAGHDFVIVDEAHHARNPLTRRYRALAALVAGVPALLLTATPIHNDRDDLVALLALFLGASAASLDDAALARCVVRRGREILAGAAQLPAVRGPISLVVDSIDDATPDAILALPPPVPAADGGVAAALVSVTLLRQWASSQGALLAAIRRRLAAAHALASTLASGRHPTRAELAAWTLGDDAQQTVMSELLAPPAHPAPVAGLRAAVASHIEGLRALRSVAAADPFTDRRRAKCLLDAWLAHPGARSIAFTQFAETVDAYWRELRDEPRICALSAKGGRVAGGAVSRAEALGSFVPGRRRCDDRARRIDRLIVTDLASEGLDLQEASVLVHLDLPWTPARLEQRVGRIVRPGSAHALVHLYTMEPPLRASSLLDIRRRLQDKLAAARAVFGEVMPDVGLGSFDELQPQASTPTLAASEAAERIEGLLQRWSVTSRHDPRNHEGRGAFLRGGTTVSIARSEVPGWLAVVGGASPRLVAAIGDQVSDAPSVVAEVCSRIDAAAVRAMDERDLASTVSRGAAALHQLDAWLDARRAASLAGVPDIPIVRGRRRLLTTIASLSTSPASARALAAPAASRALSVASRRLPASVERELRSADPDTALLVAFGARTVPPAVPSLPDHIHALIVLVGLA